MRKLVLVTALLACMMSSPVHGDDDVWTEIGLYVFISSIEGKTKIGDVTADVDASFSDIVDNLDAGFMGFLENRHGKWSFIGDVFYADLSIEKAIASNAGLSVTLDAGLKQTLTEAILGYRIFNWDFSNSRFGIDLLGGGTIQPY